MKRRAWVMSGAMALLGMVALGSEPDRSISVRVGGVVNIEAAGVDRVAVGDPSIADITVKGEAITVHGHSTGKTTVIVWRKNATERQTLTVTVSR